MPDYYNEPSYVDEFTGIDSRMSPWKPGANTVNNPVSTRAVDRAGLPISDGGAGAAAVNADRNQQSQMGKASRNVTGLAGIADIMRSLGNSLAGEYRNTFSPVNARLVGAANISPMAQADMAGADVLGASDAAIGGFKRDLGRMGINADSGRYAGTLGEMQAARAAAEAGARTRAYRQAEGDNFDRLAKVAGIGQGLLGQGVSTLSDAGSKYNAAAGANESLAGQYGEQAGNASALDQLVAILGQRLGIGGGSGGQTGLQAQPFDFMKYAPMA